MNPDTNPTTSPDAAAPLGVDPILDEAKQAADEVANEAKNIAREAQAKMAEFAEDATQQAKSFAAENKSKIATQVTAFAGALNKAAEELGHADQVIIAGYARDVAHGIDSMAIALRERGVDELMVSIQQFARTRPAAFLGAAALAGFAASRFAKASAHRASQTSAQSPGASPSMAASSPNYPDGGGQYGQGLGSSSDAASWRSTGNYPQTERGH